MLSEKNWNNFHRLYTLSLALAFFFIAGPLFIQALTSPDSASLAAENSYSPTPIRLQEAGERLTEETEYTLDASDKERYVYFDFSRSSVVQVEDPSSLNWDLAFRRTTILTNSGQTNPIGEGGAALIGQGELKNFPSVAEGIQFEKDLIPGRKAQPENKTLTHWYEYDFLRHRLSPTPSIYAIRTSDGKYAKLRILSYYCGTEPGCYTFRYIYQGNGGKIFKEE
jgi:hypothetical protein